MARKYYPVRKGTDPVSLEDLKALFEAVFKQLEDRGFFVESLGFECVDAGWIPGFVGSNPEIYFLRHLRKKELWPILKRLTYYSEADLFGVIELLYDLVSKPVDGSMHSYGGCGMHWETFDRASGRAEYRSEINDILSDYRNGFELTLDGEIVEVADVGLEPLVAAELPQSIETEIREKMLAAIRLFRSRNSSLTDRHNAVRMLADIFERIRPELRKVLTKNDENDLFNIANNFAIRHDNDNQKTGYDRALWLSWMFYFYLGTLHLASRKLQASSGLPTEV